MARTDYHVWVIFRHRAELLKIILLHKLTYHRNNIIMSESGQI